MCGINWLWYGRFALGKIGLIAGLPDYGKGQIAAFIAAAVSAGINLPYGEGNTPQGNVIWFNAEDDARDTVKPRLVAVGANPKRVYFVNGVHDNNGATKGFSLITDLPLLHAAIERIGNVKLVIIDPISAYLGVGKVDSRSATDVRGIQVWKSGHFGPRWRRVYATVAPPMPEFFSAMSLMLLGPGADEFFLSVEATDRGAKFKRVRVPWSVARP
jgi:hypothetical protein